MKKIMVIKTKDYGLIRAGGQKFSQLLWLEVIDENHPDFAAMEPKLNFDLQRAYIDRELIEAEIKAGKVPMLQGIPIRLVEKVEVKKVEYTEIKAIEIPPPPAPPVLDLTGPVKTGAIKKEETMPEPKKRR